MKTIEMRLRFVEMFSNVRSVKYGTFGV